jgi:hypothetical protein
VLVARSVVAAWTVYKIYFDLYALSWIYKLS